MADIAEDIARLAKQNSARLVPESGPVGYYLRKTGPGESDFEFVQGPRSEILEGTGDPNGVHEGRIGDLYVQRDGPSLWQNDDGQTSWVEVGAGGASTFPITYDDGTTTYTIDVDAGELVLNTVTNAGSVEQVRMGFRDDGELRLDTLASILLTAENNGIFLESNNGGGIGIEATGTTGLIEIISSGSDGDIYVVANNAEVFIQAAGGSVGAVHVEHSVVYTNLSVASISGSNSIAAHNIPAKFYTLTGNLTITAITCAGLANDETAGLTLYLKQDATGGRTVTWPSSVKWPGGVAPTLSTAPNAVDIVVLETPDQATTWYGNLAGKAYA